jgi:hypothetical protein
MKCHNQLPNDIPYLLSDQVDSVAKIITRHLNPFSCIFTACTIIIDNIKKSNIIFVLKKGR